MRTTLTLDDDVLHDMEMVRKARGSKWRVLVNEALCLGLVEMLKKPRVPAEPPTRPRPLGRCKIGEILSVSEALAFGEES